MDCVGAAPDVHFTSTKVTTAAETVTAYSTEFCGSEKSNPTDTGCPAATTRLPSIAAFGKMIFPFDAAIAAPLHFPADPPAL